MAKMDNKVYSILLLFIGVVVNGQSQQEQSIPCYDRGRRPQRCVPPFENLAYKKTVEATNTCGVVAAQTFCLQIGSGQTGRERDTLECRVCDNSRYELSHSPKFLTDFNNNDNTTWWQSETMLEGIQFPNTVNLTLRLGHEFEITYVRLRFRSSRPESMAIFKRTAESGPQVAWQFFSSSCELTYGLRTDETITKAAETKALCTDKYSDIIPVSNGEVVFSTLENRPSAYTFDKSPILQEWVTASEIDIVFTRLNTYGDEIFGYNRVLQSYFYAVSDLAVGGRCKCNGHASSCSKSTGPGLPERYVCSCEHNTDGPSCQTCKPFYNDRPWRAATATDAHECQACDCHGLSENCFYDDDLYRQTGRGGHCLECRDNTAGPHCERCKDNYYRRTDQERCQTCSCDAIGSETQQCDSNGQCRCKPGVIGQRCDQCKPNFYNLGTYGCRPCECRPEGSTDNPPQCDTTDGSCNCKELVEGRNCDRCKPGYFGLAADNPMGCISCFCYGHSSQCTSATGYHRKVIRSDFTSGAQGWTGILDSGESVSLKVDPISGTVSASAPGSQTVYFLAPERYRGDHRFSYNQLLTFKFRVGDRDARASLTDVVISGAGMQVSIPIYYQGNQAPRTVEQNYQFRLHESQTYQWTPSLSSREFMKMLSNITSIKIRATYTTQGVGILSEVQMESAMQGGSGEPVNHVEQCTCVEGYVGQFCESCAPGYHREPPYGGPLARCVPCNCNGHSDVCEVNTGRCICQHNTVGDNCERCAPGYHGYALSGTAEDCKRCPCPNNGECVELLNGDVACINCQEGYTGNRCDQCQDGHYGDPSGRHGPRSACQKCICNGNIDPNAVANCNTTTGDCLKCIYSTAGRQCDRCLPGYYGDPIAVPKGQCKPCNCYGPGSQGGPAVSCDSVGRCQCKTNVVGDKCDQCRESTWNIDSGRGCEPCNCNTIGSHNSSCDLRTGQCHNKGGVEGLTGDKCKDNHYAFSITGCKPCDCNPDGSVSLQCDLLTGDCKCLPNIMGKKCDKCSENKYNISAGCIDCPACYNLVQDAVNLHRHKLTELRRIIEDIGDNPQAINDSNFRAQMKAVNQSVNDLLRDAEMASGLGANNLADQLKAIQAALMEVMDKCGRITTDIRAGLSSSRNSIEDVNAAEEAIRLAEERLQEAESLIDNDGMRILQEAKDAQEKAGQQSNELSNIAAEARKLADRHTKQAEAIYKTAVTALNTSVEAQRLTSEALDTPADTAEDLRIVEVNLNGADALLQQAKDLADEALKEATDAYEKALQTVIELEGINIPSVDIGRLRDEIRQIKTDAANIKEEAAKLRKQHADLIDMVTNQKAEAEALLRRGEEQQQRLDGLFADADRAKDIATKAVQKSEATLKEAKDMLEILKGFRSRVEASKARAEEALKKIPEIEAQIKEAEDITAQANANLADAEKNAQAASDIAQVAKTTAEMARDTAKMLKTESSATKTKAAQTRADSEDRAEKVDELDTEIRDLERQATEDELRAQEALRKATTAKNIAAKTSQDVAMALDSVNNIMRQLENLDKLDERKVDELERALNGIEDDLRNRNITGAFDQIVADRNLQHQLLVQYSNEIVNLTKAVDNLRDIDEALHRVPCMNKINLEPTNLLAG